MMRRIVIRISGTILLGLCLALSVSTAVGQADGQKTFANSHDAVNALIQSLRANNKDELQAILGPGTDDMIPSGDEVMDKAERQRFLAKYDAKHSLVSSADGEITLNVGKDDWPLPIPLTKAGGKWYFDGAAGKEEILYRRIGRNELAAINVCQGVVTAQKDYAAAGHDGKPAGSYAARVVSAPGKQDGLYWEVKEGESPSPAGPMLANAVDEGYAQLTSNSQPTPYHGYFYRMLKNPGGFGFIAHPAEYRVSGVMTFIVSQDGVIYQKDLGGNTSKAALEIKEFKTDSTWKRAE